LFDFGLWPYAWDHPGNHGIKQNNEHHTTPQKESEAGQPCTTPAELCSGSGQACDLRVVTLPFKQFGSASGTKRACIVEADVAIGKLGGWACCIADSVYV
jgi:hypothetical protein